MKNIQEATLQQSLVLLPDSDTNIPKLLAANEKCKNKMKNLQAQWQKHKETLLSRRDELKKITNLKTVKIFFLFQSSSSRFTNVGDVLERKKSTYGKYYGTEKRVIRCSRANRAKRPH